MFIDFCASYLGYIDVAELESKSHYRTRSARLKGIDHGNLHRHNEEYGTQGSAGPSVRFAAGRTSEVDIRFEHDWRCADVDDRGSLGDAFGDELPRGVQVGPGLERKGDRREARYRLGPQVLGVGDAVELVFERDGDELLDVEQVVETARAIVVARVGTTP